MRASRRPPMSIPGRTVQSTRGLASSARSTNSFVDPRVNTFPAVSDQGSARLLALLQDHGRVEPRGDLPGVRWPRPLRSPVELACIQSFRRRAGGASPRTNRRDRAALYEDLRRCYCCRMVRKGHRLQERAASNASVGAHGFDLREEPLSFGDCAPRCSVCAGVGVRFRVRCDGSLEPVACRECGGVRERGLLV